ncbi:MAG: hypothetical protein J6R77_03245, partial [Clostridia bacterium]|nr:hypothetical protein [Clostridia bacterium]
MKQRILSWILVVALMLTVCPMSGAAEEWTATVPITVAFTGATGIDLNIRLNPLLVETATLVDPADSMGQATYAAHQNSDKMKVAIASATPISNEGVLFYLRLTLKAEAGAEDELCKLLQVKINEKIAWQANDCILLTGVKDGGIYNRDV